MFREHVVVNLYDLIHILNHDNNDMAFESENVEELVEYCDRWNY
jgi:hypothetical protein